MEQTEQKPQRRFTTVHVGYRDEGLYRRYHAHGLFFEGTEAADENVVDIMSDPKTRELLGSITVVEDRGSGVVIHNNLADVPNPDQAKPDAVVHYVKNGSLHKFRVVERFSQCQEPARDLMGCAECPSKGIPCLSGQVHGVETLPVEEGVSKDILKVLKDNKDNIQGYRYVSPVLLAEPSETFVAGSRVPDSIDWSAEEERRERRKVNSARAAQTRAFKKEECGKCIAAQAGCVRVHSCHEAYKPAEVHDQYVRENLLTCIGKPDNQGNTLADWQVYAVMRLGYAEGVRAWDRRQVMLGGLEFSGDGLRVRVLAYKGKPARSHVTTNDWAELRKRFPSLPEGPDHPNAQRPDENAMILYFAALEQRYFAPVLRGFHGYESDPISWIRVHDHGVEVSRFRQYWVSRTYGHKMYNWSDFYKHLGELPVVRQSRRRY